MAVTDLLLCNPVTLRDGGRFHPTAYMKAPLKTCLVGHHFLIALWEKKGFGFNPAGQTNPQTVRFLISIFLCLIQHVFPPLFSFHYLLPVRAKMVDVVSARTVPSETEVRVARSFLTKILRSSMRYHESVCPSLIFSHGVFALCFVSRGLSWIAHRPKSGASVQKTCLYLYSVFLFCCGVMVLMWFRCHKTYILKLI